MRVAVIGSGSWGTAVAGLLGEKGNEVRLWARRKALADAINTEHRNPDYLSSYTLSENISASSDFAWVLDSVEVIVMVVPSYSIRSVAEEMKAFVSPDTPIVVLTKGIEKTTSLILTDVLAEVLGNNNRMAALSGPNHAEEVSRKKPTAAVVGAQDPHIAKMIQELFFTDYFRMYTSDDLLGVEILAAAKNIIAIAVGINVGLGFGDNASALLMTRGLAEISRLIKKLGGNPQTAMSLAGMGDLITTCISENSRNRTFGYAFSQGESLEDYQKRRHMVVEGANAVISVRELAHKHGVEVPITEAVYQALYEDKDIEELISALFSRAPRDEFYGL
ncbi:MAG: NAD(P)H-dependent glycerol-3-phosphate dehydrogenase [Coriobacteriia bacterium]|nr:NAD(P)H-dependent glycerol-3-phosphate dehydrogenase [Coriobacteriia bacterium]